MGHHRVAGLCACAAGAVAAAILAGSLIGGAALQAAPRAREGKQGEAPAEKTAGEAFKNVKVLKDIPASQLMPAMFFISASLGVGCDHCHVTSKDGPWPMEKDDKKQKDAARKMMEMMRAINDQNFGGNTEVTCATCHQGRAEPTGLPPVPPLGAKLGEEDQAATKDLPSADKVLDRYLEALGGSAALEKLKTREATGTLVTESGKTYQVRLVQKAPELFAMTISGPGLDQAGGFDGKAPWQRWGKEAFVQQGIEGVRIARSGEFWVDTEVKKHYPRRFVAGVEKVGEEEAYVVRAGGPGDISEKLSFSKATGLLLRRVVLTRTALGRLPQETDFADYRQVDGVKVPFTVQRMEINTRYTVKFSEIKHNVPLDDAVFQKPAGTK